MSFKTSRFQLIVPEIKLGYFIQEVNYAKELIVTLEINPIVLDLTAKAFRSFFVAANKILKQTLTELTEIYTLFEPRSNDVKEGSINTRLCASAKDPGTYLHPESELFA